MTAPSGPCPTSAPTRPRRRALAVALAMLAAVATLAVPAGAAVAAPEPGQYVPVAPVTVVNNLSLAAGATTTATVTGVGGVPPAAGVAAVAVNLIANQPAAAGHLTLFPAGAARPVDSTLNYQAGRTVAGFEVVRVSPAGQLSVFAAAATRVIVRVRGYYTSAASTVTGSRFVPVPPATVVNDVAVAAGGTTTFTASGNTGANGIPASPNVKALAVNVIANQPAGTGHLQVHPAGPSRPLDSTLNFSKGRTTAGHEVVPVSADGRITIFTPTATRVVVRLRGWYAPAPGPSGADWAQERNGPTHPGTNPAEAVLTATTVRGLGQAWSAAVGESRGGAAVVDDRVYVNSSGRVRALDAATGATRWTAALAGAIRSAPAVAGGALYVGSADGRLFALDAATGAPRWNALVGFTAVAAPAVADGMVYAGSGDGRLAAVDAASGAVRWTTTVGGNPMFSQGPSPAPQRSRTAWSMSPAPTTGGSTPWTRPPGPSSGTSPPGPRCAAWPWPTGSSTRPGPWGSAPPSCAPWTPPPGPPCGRSAAART